MCANAMCVKWSTSAREICIYMKIKACLELALVSKNLNWPPTKIDARAFNRGLDLEELCLRYCREESQKEIRSRSDWKICISEGESMGLKMRMSSA